MKVARAVAMKFTPAADRLAPAGTAAGLRRPRLLVLAPLPPPAHGAAAVSLQVVRSQALAARFALDVLSTAMAGDLTRIRRFEFGKLWRSLVLFWRVVRRAFGAARPDLAYLTLSAGGWAFHRDVLLIALLRAPGSAACCTCMDAASPPRGRAGRGACRSIALPSRMRA